MEENLNQFSTNKNFSDDQISPDPIIKPLNLEDEESSGMGRIFPKKLGFVILAVVLGIFTGWGVVFYQQKTTSFEEGKMESLTGEKVAKGEVYGRDDDIFQDTAVGVVEEKEENTGEGTHKLLREGGESQTAYLTSSVLDLNMFIGRKVQVWGQTFSSEKVGWLMDVGKVKVLD